MTDLQLAILLRQYHTRLLSELNKLEQELPDSLKIEQQVRNFISGSVSTRVECPVLADLYEWSTELEKAIEFLEKRGS